MTNAEDNIEIIKALLQTTRQRLMEAIVANIELETAVAIERERVKQLEDLLSPKVQKDRAQKLD